MTKLRTLIRKIIISIIGHILNYILISRKVIKIKIYKYNFIILPKVFRPDISYSTYILTLESLRYLKDRKFIKIADICTGSGIIGILISKIFRKYVILVDISKNAIKNCILNTRILNVDNLVDVVISDSCKAFRLKSLDFVIINPPYLPCSGSVEICYRDLREFISMLKYCRYISKFGILYTTSSLSEYSYGKVVNYVKTPIDTIYVMFLV